MPSNIQSFNQHENREEKVSRLKPKIPHPLEPVSRYPLYIYIYISRHTITSLLKKTSVPFPTEKRRIERPVDRKKWKRIKRIARFVISAFLPEKEARATGRAAASLRRLEGEESEGRGERRRSGRIDEKSCAVARA